MMAVHIIFNLVSKLLIYKMPWNEKDKVKLEISSNVVICKQFICRKMSTFLTRIIQDN